MINWDEAIKKGLRMYCNREAYTYFYGAKGQMLTDDLMDQLMEEETTHFSKYSTEEIQQIKRNSRGKIGYDCSGFVACLTGDSGYSTAQKNNSAANTSVVAGPAGSVVYTTFNGRGRHIALDIGYGAYLEMARETTDAVKEAGTGSIQLHMFFQQLTPWEYSGKSNCVNYEGATNR